jgi:hypothetical protein
MKTLTDTGVAMCRAKLFKGRIRNDCSFTFVSSFLFSNFLSFLIFFAITMNSSQPSRPTTSYDESRPLLPNQQACESQHSVEANQTPLPKIQLAVLCSLRLLDPLAFTQIFPYVNQFMNDLGLTNDSSQIGFYSGLVVGISFCLASLRKDIEYMSMYFEQESVFAISQLLAICPWAWLSGELTVFEVVFAFLSLHERYCWSSPRYPCGSDRSRHGNSLVWFIA